MGVQYRLVQDIRPENNYFSQGAIHPRTHVLDSDGNLYSALPLGPELNWSWRGFTLYSRELQIISSDISPAPLNIMSGLVSVDTIRDLLKALEALDSSLFDGDMSIRHEDLLNFLKSAISTPRSIIAVS